MAKVGRANCSFSTSTCREALSLRVVPEEDGIARIAAEQGFQLFVERVGEGKECTVVISEGEIKSE